MDLSTAIKVAVLPGEDVPFCNSHKLPTQTAVAVLLSISRLDDKIKALKLETTYGSLLYPHIHEDIILPTKARRFILTAITMDCTKAF